MQATEVIVCVDTRLMPIVPGRIYGIITNRSDLDQFWILDFHKMAFTAVALTHRTGTPPPKIPERIIAYCVIVPQYADKLLIRDGR